MVTTLGNRANSLSVSALHTGVHTHTHTHCFLSKTRLMLFSRFCSVYQTDGGSLAWNRLHTADS